MQNTYQELSKIIFRNFFPLLVHVHIKTSFSMLKWPLRLKNYYSSSHCHTQVPIYLLFYEGGIFRANALTLVGSTLIPYIGITLEMITF